MSDTYLDLLAYMGISGAHPGGFALTQSILQNETIQSTDAILDIGCGTGQTAAFLAKKFDCDVTAIDNHPVMIEKAMERRKGDARIKVREGDAQNLDFIADTFDFILSESVLVFTDIRKTLHEISRVLKSKGSLILIEMTAEQSIPEEVLQQIRMLYGIQHVPSEVEWISHLQQAGFTKINKLNIPSTLTPSEIDDIHPSANLRMELYDLWEAHNYFMLQHGHLLSFRALKCQLA